MSSQFKPEMGEKYFTITSCAFNHQPCTCWEIVVGEWANNVGDVLRLKAGWVWRTEEEALKNLQKLAEEYGVNADMRGLSAFDDDDNIVTYEDYYDL